MLLHLIFRNEGKTRKRDKKRKYKNSKKGRFTRIDGAAIHKPPKRTGSRPVLDGVSIFDLIIPWKKHANEK